MSGEPISMKATVGYWSRSAQRTTNYWLDVNCSSRALQYNTQIALWLQYLPTLEREGCWFAILSSDSKSYVCMILFICFTWPSDSVGCKAVDFCSKCVSKQDYSFPVPDLQFKIFSMLELLVLPWFYGDILKLCEKAKLPGNGFMWSSIG